MYCWNCGHKNPDSNKFCGECGRTQGRPSGFGATSGSGEVSTINSLKTRERRKTGGEISSFSDSSAGQKAKIIEPPQEHSSPRPPAGIFNRRATDKIGMVNPPQNVPEPIPSDFGLHPSQVEPAGGLRAATPSGPGEIPGLLNPPNSEGGAVRETLATSAGTTAGTPTTSSERNAQSRRPLNKTASIETPRPAASGRQANRISGPSFLGLSNDPSADSSYLLDDDSAATSSSSWPAVLALSLLIVFGVLLVKQWGPISNFGRTYAERAGIAADHKKAAKPANDAVHHPEAAVSSGEAVSDPDKKSAESDDTVANNAGGTAADRNTDNMEKPESDNLDAGNKSSAKKSGIEPAYKSSDAPDTNTRAEKPDAAAPGDAEAKKAYDKSQVQLAEKYIYGRGVPQDCGRAINLLQSSAAHQNPNAEIKLGALYATGQCVAQDRAQAYRWYSKAKQLEPGNTWLQYSLNSLWASMSVEERQSAQSL